MGQPAARIGDPVAHLGAAGVISTGCFSVRIEGRLAVRKGDAVIHNNVPEIVTTGERTVRIGGTGLLAARMGDKVACKGWIQMASPTVRIGLTPGCNCLQQASDNGTPYVQPAPESSAHGPDLPPPADD